MLTAVFPVLAVPDLSAAIAWYRDVLGFEPRWTWGDPAVRAGVARDDLEVQLVVSGTPGAPAGPSRVAFHLTQVDAYHRRCRDRGATMELDIGDRPWGMRDFRVVDPGGNVLGFAEPLGR